MIALNFSAADEGEVITEKNNAYNYKEFKNFKKDLLKVNKSRKINSLFSKRLKI